MPFRRFEHIGDILRAPELTVYSPFLTAPIITGQVDLKTQQYLLKDIDTSGFRIKSCRCSRFGDRDLSSMRLVNRSSRSLSIRNRCGAQLPSHWRGSDRERWCELILIRSQTQTIPNTASPM